MIERVLNTLLDKYEDGREKALARTKFEEGFLWLTKAKPKNENEDKDNG